jgi:hypothetical protein
MDSTSLTLAKLSEMLHEIGSVYYFVNPFIPKSEPVTFWHLDADDVYLVCSENEEIFKTAVKQAGLNPVLLSRDEWAERSLKRHPLFRSSQTPLFEPKFNWEYKSWKKW